MFYEYGFDSYSPYQSEICIIPEDNILIRNIDEATNSLTPGNQLFKHYDLNLSKKEIDALNQFSMKGYESGFTDSSPLSESIYLGKELRQFMHSISSSDKINDITDIIINLVNAIKITGSIDGNTTHLNVHASHNHFIQLNNAKNLYRWHYDTGNNYDDIYDCGEFENKRIITLVGPNTMFYHSDEKIKEIAEVNIDSQFSKHEDLIDYSKVSRADFGQGSVFKACSALHSLPIEQEAYRLLIVINKDNDAPKFDN